MNERKRTLKKRFEILKNPVEQRSTFPLDSQISTFLITVAVIVNTVAELQISVSTRDTFNWILIKFFSLFIWYFSVLIITATFSKLKIIRTNLSFISTIGAGVGFLVGLFIYYFGEFFEVNLLDSSLIFRVVTTTLFGAGWFPVGAILSEKRKSLPEFTSRDFDSPQNNMRENFRNSRFYKKFVIYQNRFIEQELEKIINKIVGELTYLKAKSVPVLQRQDEILKILESNELRELSLKVTDKKYIKFEPSKARIYFFGLRNYFTTLTNLTLKSIKSNPVNANIFTFLVAMAYTGFEIRLQRLDQTSIFFYGVLVLILTGFCGMLLNKIHIRLENNFFQLSLLVYLFNIVGLVYIGISLTNANNDQFTPNSEFSIVISLIFLYFTLLILDHLIQSGVISTNNVLGFRKILILSKMIEKEMLWEQYLLIGSRWSVHIHGKVQTRISATVLALKQAAATSNEIEFTNALSALIELLNGNDVKLRPIYRNLDEELAARLEPWNGLVEFETIIDEKLNFQHGSWVRVLGEVVEEVISNAVRHGGATHIRLEVRSLTRTKILLFEEDNSPQIPPNSSNSRSGLGTTIFSAASLGRWKLTRDIKRAKTVFQLQMNID